MIFILTFRLSHSCHGDGHILIRHIGHWSYQGSNLQDITTYYLTYETYVEKRVVMEFESRVISYFCSSILHLWAQKTEDGLKQK